jgi:hypothetical protein
MHTTQSLSLKFEGIVPAMKPRVRGELEQIQFLLGDASVQTTERYLGGRIKTMVNLACWNRPTP